jgi:hypothetical protein
VAGLPDGLDTLLGPGGTSLSAGEEQLVAFARLLVRDVQLVVLDEATARMDPVTEARVVRASDRLLAGRTGIVIATASPPPGGPTGWPSWSGAAWCRPDRGPGWRRSRARSGTC